MRSMMFFNFLLEATLGGSALILLACLCRALLRRAVGSRLVYMAWLLVALRLLLPIALPNPAVDALRPGLSTDEAARPIADQIRTRFLDAVESLPELLPAECDKSDDPVRRFALATRHGRTGTTALMIYAGAGLLVGAGLLITNARARRRLRRDRVRPLEGDAQERYIALCERFHVRKPIPVYYVDPLPSACFVGALRPFIALPMSTPEESLPLVLAHMLCHRRALDMLWGLVRGLCLALHCLNPLVWMAARLSRRDAELACDERAAARLSEDERARYGELIAAGACCATARPFTLATGANNTARRSSEYQKLAQPTAARRWLQPVLIGLWLFALLFSFATRESDALPKVSDAPKVSWAAALTPLDSEEAAVAYARRFMESPFTAECTDSMRFEAMKSGDGWRIYATEDGHAMPALLLADAQGRLLLYENFREIGDIPVGKRKYAHQSPLESVSKYVDAFLRAEAPGREYAGAQVIDDVLAGDMRYVILRTKGTEGGAEFVTLLVEPEARVLCYQLEGVDTPMDVMCALDAQRVASFDLTEVYSFSHRCIDAGRFATERDETGGWTVRYELDKASATGEALDRLSDQFPDARAYSFVWRLNANGEVVERSGWQGE